MKIPRISGAWQVLFKPEKNGNYVNDHSVVIGADGKWHLYGITSFEGIPAQERYFVHGVGESLLEPLSEVGRSIDRGTLAWAPCVIRKDENYYMFCCLLCCSLLGGMAEAVLLCLWLCCRCSRLAVSMALRRAIGGVWRAGRRWPLCCGMPLRYGGYGLLHP